jgi:hypothetical protein
MFFDSEYARESNDQANEFYDGKSSKVNIDTAAVVTRLTEKS